VAGAYALGAAKKRLGKGGKHCAALSEAVPSMVWPADGQAAVQIGQSQVQAGPNQHAAAIASVGKVMTAYLVLRDHPLRLGQDGPTITLTDADVAGTDRRRRQQESVVSIAAGEQLTELQALQALLLPSANNIAAVLARWDAGSTDRFVARMNATARSLGMTHTRYTDPSGHEDATVSTAADQVRVVDRAMRLPVFASIVAAPSATLPVAGIVHNTNTLLGHNGFVGSCWASPPQPDRGGSRGRRRHGRPHRRSSGYARSTATNPATTNCAPNPSTTTARPCTPTRETIQRCSSDQHTRQRTVVDAISTRGEHVSGEPDECVAGVAGGVAAGGGPRPRCGGRTRRPRLSPGCG
jgi:hypothetical protein